MLPVEYSFWNTVVYDLWDEAFTYKQKSENSETSKKILGKENILQQVQRVQVTVDIPFSELKEKSGYEISLRVVVDPISKEKKEKIRTWISENRVNFPASSNLGGNSKSGGRSIGSEASTIESVKTTVINQMIDSELAKEETEGAWVFDSDKQPLVIKDNGHEK